ncbi:MAG TPA: DUF1761 domain-containing protein [Candidatus Paceibacterota bacterium]
MTINYWAVLASAVASMIVGGLWYGPLFGKTFISAHGWDKRSKEEQNAMKKGMAWNYLWQFIASVVMFSVLNIMIVSTGSLGIMGAIHIALLLWLGFVVTLAFGNTLWGGKMIFFWLSIGNMFLTLVIAGAIIGGWR